MDERILLVEDDTSIREVTALGLARAGFRVTAAADGREGLQRARRAGIDLALTATEFRLLLELARHAGQVMMREQLLRRVWNYDYLRTHGWWTLRCNGFEASWRPNPAAPRIITTVRGVGYRLGGRPSHQRGRHPRHAEAVARW